MDHDPTLKYLLATSKRCQVIYKSQCLQNLIKAIYVARIVLFLTKDDTEIYSTKKYMVGARLILLKIFNIFFSVLD